MGQSPISHLDNTATNLTTGTSAGATTSPVNSVPSASAPFYVAFDATSINNHYEMRKITSKTATNILHAATSYDHTTAEEIRLVNPAIEFDAIYQPPQGYMINGKLSVTVASNNLTVALKTLAGTDPSATDPVYCRIGDTVRSITAALSVTKNAGTNWCNAGSSELATKEIDYFVYLGYNATDGVVIGFSRFPGANQYSDFSATTTNEKYCAISTITTAASTDYYEVIGRFAATLSAGAGYTWSVPTFTAINLIQRPIYETRKLSFAPTYSASGSMTYGTITTTEASYKISGSKCRVFFDNSGTTGGTPSNEIKMTVPFTPGASSNVTSTGSTTDAAFTVGFGYVASGVLFVRKSDSSNFAAGAGRGCRQNLFYEI